MAIQQLVKRRQWKDLGNKPERTQSTVQLSTSYPSLYLDSNQIGDIFDVGEDVTFLIQAKISSLSKDKNGKISYSIDLIKLKVVNQGDTETADESIVGT